MSRLVFIFVLLFMAAISAFMFILNMNFVQLAGEKGQPVLQSIDRPDHADFIFRYSEMEQHLVNYGMVEIDRSVPGIRVELSYSTNENFMDTILYPQMKRAFAESWTVKKLIRARDFLHTIDSSLILVVMDAARPQSVQWEMWKWAQRAGKTKYVAAPSLGSNHNFGCAVDVTIAGPDSLLDMGTAHDHFGPEAEPRYQWAMLESGSLTREQIDNRLLLKKVMRAAGFQTIQTEWWHFNSFSKYYAREHFKLIP